MPSTSEKARGRTSRRGTREAAEDGEDPGGLPGLCGARTRRGDIEEAAGDLSAGHVWRAPRSGRTSLTSTANLIRIYSVATESFLRGGARAVQPGDPPLHLRQGYAGVARAVGVTPLSAWSPRCDGASHVLIFLTYLQRSGILALDGLLRSGAQTGSGSGVLLAESN